MKLNYFLILALLTVCFGVYAQDTMNIIVDTTIVPPPGSGGDVSEFVLPLMSEWFDHWVGPIMVVGFNVFGYFSKWIPLFNKIKQHDLRLFAVAVATAAGYAVYGGDIFQVLVSYASATSLYELLWRRVVGTSKEVQAKLTPDRE